MSGTIRTAAHAAVACGWSVLPVRASGKAPLIAWKRYPSVRATEADLDYWFARWPDANIAAITGKPSDIVVLDADANHDGPASLARLEAENEPLPLTVEACSGGGGRHLYFRYPGRYQPNRLRFAPGLDLRGDGGSIVLPPSVHASGRPYTWRRGKSPDECRLADMPEWLQGIVGFEPPHRVRSRHPLYRVPSRRKHAR